MEEKLPELCELRKLLVEQQIRWLHTHKSKTATRISELDVKLSRVSNFVYNSDDYVNAGDLIKDITLEDVEECFYGFEAKQQRELARKLLVRTKRRIHSQLKMILS